MDLFQTKCGLAAVLKSPILNKILDTWTRNIDGLTITSLQGTRVIYHRTFVTIQISTLSHNAEY